MKVLASKTDFALLIPVDLRNYFSLKQMCMYVWEETKKETQYIFLPILLIWIC